MHHDMQTGIISSSFVKDDPDSQFELVVYVAVLPTFEIIDLTSVTESLNRSRTCAG